MKRTNQSFFQAVKSALIGGVLLGLAAAPFAADAAESTLKVSATVLKHASLQVVSQPGSVAVTAADIARGYVDVPATSQLMVKSNTADGYMLNFASQGDFFSQATVRGLGNDVQLGADGGGVARRAAAQGMTQTSLDLGFRFTLSASAQQGVYAWPMRVSVTPL